MFRRTLNFVFCLAVLLIGSVQAQDYSRSLPHQEMRGLWVVRDSITSPHAIRRVVQQASRHHFNALFVEVRSRGDAFYRSDLAPRAEELAGTPADFDPLAETLRKPMRRVCRSMPG